MRRAGKRHGRGWQFVLLLGLAAACSGDEPAGPADPLESLEPARRVELQQEFAGYNLACVLRILVARAPDAIGVPLEELPQETLDAIESCRRGTRGSLIVQLNVNSRHEEEEGTFGPFVVEVDGKLSRSIPENSSERFRQLAAGDHTVELNLPADCFVKPSNPRIVTVPAGATAKTTFHMSCGEGAD